MPDPQNQLPPIELTLDPKADDLRPVSAALFAFNRSQVPENRSRLFLLRIDSPEGELLGGLYGHFSYDWLFIDALWVAEPLRHQGQGSRLLHRAEQLALEHGCHSVWLDTFSFQARGFYEKHGYTVFGELPHYPAEHTRYFLSKRLGAQ